MGSKIEREILTLEDARYSAMLAGDVAALEKLLDKDLTYAHSNGLTQKKPEYLAEFKTRHYEAIDRDVVNSVVRGDTALVYSNLHIRAVVRGLQRDVKTFALAVWSKNEVGWQLLALHSIGHPK